MLSIYSKLMAILLFGIIAPYSLAAGDRDTSINCSSRILIAPTLVKDTILGAALEKKSRATIAKNYQLPCLAQNFVGADIARRSFDYIGMNSFFTISPSELPIVKIQRIISDTRATHLVFPTWNHQTTKLNLKIYFADEYYQLIHVRTIRIILNNPEALPRAPSFVNWLALLTPNTVTLGVVNTEVNGFETGDDAKGLESKETEHFGKLPPVISSIGFNKIEHPDNFRLFGASGTIFPSTFLYAIDQSTRFGPIASEEPSDLDQIASIKIYGLCGNINAMGSIHSPLGTTYIGIGVGPCFYQRRKDFEGPVTYLDVAWRYLFGHRVFVSKNSYIFLEGDGVNFERPIYQSDFVKSSSIGRSTLGIGYYFSDIEHRYTNIVSSWFQ